MSEHTPIFKPKLEGVFGDHGNRHLHLNIVGMPLFFDDDPDHAREIIRNSIGGFLGRTALDGTRIAELHYIEVDKESRRRGYGKLLLRAFTRIAMEKGAEELHLNGYIGYPATVDLCNLLIHTYGPERTKFYEDLLTHDGQDSIADKTKPISHVEAFKRLARNRALWAVYREYDDVLIETFGDEVRPRNLPEEIQKSRNDFWKEINDMYTPPVNFIVNLRGLDTSSWSPDLKVRYKERRNIGFRLSTGKDEYGTYEYLNENQQALPPAKPPLALLEAKQG